MIYSSRTITFMAIMAGLEAANIGLAAFTDLISPMIFASISGLITMLIAIGGVKLRFMTTTAVGDK